MNVLVSFFGVLIVHTALVSCECFVFNGAITLGLEEMDKFDCIPSLYANDSRQAFVTHSWNGAFVSSGGYAVMASLVFGMDTACSGVRVRRTAGTGVVSVNWFVVVCRNGEINNVWRGDLNYSTHYMFDGNYSNLFGTAVNVSTNSLILGSFSIGAGVVFSRDDFACVEFRPGPMEMGTNPNKTFGVRFAFPLDGNNEKLSNATAHVQVVDWNSTAASLLNAANRSAIPFVTACGVGLSTEPNTNFAEVAAVFNPSDRSIAIDPPNLNFSLASQFLRFADDVASVAIDRVILNARETSKNFRNITALNIWAIILGTSNLLGVPAAPAASITDVAVTVDRSLHQFFVRRAMSDVALTVYVATIVFDVRPTPTTTVPVTPATTRSPPPPTSDHDSVTTSYQSSTTFSTFSTVSTSSTSTTPILASSSSGGATAQETPNSTESALAVDPAIVGGAAGGGGALLLIIVSIFAFCACKARKSKRATTETPAPVPLSQLNVNMSSVRYEHDPIPGNAGVYGDVSDVRTSRQLYDDVGDVQQQSN